MVFIKIKSLMHYILILAVFFVIYNCSEEKSTNGPTEKGPEVVIFPDPLYFGRIPAGQSMERQFLLSNIGDVELVSPQLVIEGMSASLFSLVDVSGEVKVGLNKTIFIKVKFSPSAAGEFASRVKIESNAESSPDYANLIGRSTEVNGDNIIFERIIGGIDGEGSSGILQTSDGGFILSGSALNVAADVNIAELTRLDKYGNVLWRKQFPGLGLSGFSGLVIEDDGGFVAVGQTSTSARSNNKIFLVKTDQTGVLVWETIHGGDKADKGTDLVKVNDGYVITGETNNVPEDRGVKDLLIAKFDKSGNFVWTNNFGNAEGEGGNSIHLTLDGGFILSGFRSTGATGFDVYMVRTDDSANLIWEKTFGGADWDVSNSVIATDDGGFLNGGYSVGQGQGGRDVYLVKTDSDGNELWSKIYGGTANDEASAIIKTSDGGFLVVGNSQSFQQGINDIYILKLDQNGDLIWEENIGGNGADEAYDVIELDNGFAVCGSTRSYSGASAIYVIRLNSEGKFQ